MELSPGLSTQHVDDQGWTAAGEERSVVPFRRWAYAKPSHAQPNGNHTRRARPGLWEWEWEGAGPPDGEDKPSDGRGGGVASSE